MWLNVVSPLRTGITGLMNAPSLDSLRQEIDAIDGELHGLIGRRADVVGRIAARRSRPADWRCARAARPRSCASGWRRHKGPFPVAAVFRMWREMMCAFTLMQTPGLKIAICRPADQPGYWDLARDHFGCQIPLRRPRHAGPGAGRGARRADDARRRAGADRGRCRARGGRCWPAATRPCPTSWPACPSSPCPTPGRAASRPSCWPAWSPRKAATIAP